MKISNLLIVLAVLLSSLGVVNLSYANSKATLVITTFVDNTEYRKIGSPSIFNEYLLSQIDMIDSFSIIEYIDESISKESENFTEVTGNTSFSDRQNSELSEDDIAFKKAIANDDFGYMFSQNEINIDQGDPTKSECDDNGEIQSNFSPVELLERKNSNLDLNKAKNKFLPKLKKVVEQYEYRYALCGSIDYLKSGIEEHSGIGNIPTEKKPYIEVGLTAYIIDVVEEKIIWSKVLSGIDKDTALNWKGFTVGTSELNSDLFYDALEKVGKKLVKELSKDLKKGKLILRKDDEK